MVGTGVRRAGTSIGGLLAGTLASATLAGVLALHVRAVLVDHLGPWRVDAVIELAVAAVGSLVAAWLAAGALLAAVCVVVRAAGASWRAGERLVHRCAPQVVRKALVLAVGAGIGLGVATGASAAAPEPAATASATVAATDAAVRDDLGWAVTTRSTTQTTTPPSTAAAATPTPQASSTSPAPSATTPSTVATTAVEPAPDQGVDAPAPPGAPTEVPLTEGTPSEVTTTGYPTTAPAPHGAVATTVVVAVGDSLWSIAARHLAPGAGDAQIAAAWPRWYDVNSGVIGADPDVIQSGEVLTVPVTAEEPAL
ncbi:LysM peptidoglycan-binding domain-containing protein [Cellulomonas sp. Leaf395]|uniref:LysM peptidoglycan-binding domain-containing protein n=1 Tax=Cellulomonas sp. Leaf395 TaxID=1736362 RepID=UPI0006F3D2CB|nr:LysM domain-containing protein [Cellulomonas sp. Leaf395]KQS99813.1 hypothetical protein ASG23_10825 [Cellulomonas sp. Leaf395]